MEKDEYQNIEPYQNIEQVSKHKRRLQGQICALDKTEDQEGQELGRELTVDCRWAYREGSTRCTLILLPLQISEKYLACPAILQVKSRKGMTQIYTVGPTFQIWGLTSNPHSLYKKGVGTSMAGTISIRKRDFLPDLPIITPSP